MTRPLIVQVAFGPSSKVGAMNQEELLHSICVELLEMSEEITKLRERASDAERKHSYRPDEQA